MFRSRCVLFSVFLTGVPLAPAAGAQGLEPSSFIELPLRIPLQPLYREIERRTPREVRSTQHPEKRWSAEVHYAARRSPLQLSMQRDVLFARTLVSYWVKARKKVLGKIPVDGSCGVNEPPRGVVLSSASRIGIRSDWRLWTNTRVYPPQFMNPCQMTFASIDVTGLIAGTLYRELWKTANTQIDAAIPRLADLRGPAESAWRRIQEPIQIGSGEWLVFQPNEVFTTPPNADGRELEVTIGLAANVRLTSGQRPTPPKVPLPPLRIVTHRHRGVQLPARVSLAYADANRLLASRVQDQTITWLGRTGRIERLRLASDQRGLVLTVWVTGEFAGTVHLYGKPSYDEQTSEIYFDPLDYRLETDDTKVSATEEAMHDLFRSILLSKARWPVADRIEELRLRLERALSDAGSDSFEVTTKLKALRPTAIHAAEEAIIVDGVVQGAVRLSPL